MSGGPRRSRRCVVRAAYLGEETGDLSALENPLAVEEIVRALYALTGTRRLVTLKLVIAIGH